MKDKEIDVKKIENIMEAADMCVRCGACKSVCPTYDVLRKEGGGPRGRVSLVEAQFKGNAGFGPDYLSDIKNCTLCGSCYGACPNGVNVPEMVLQARAEHVRTDGLPAVASFTLKNLLKSDKLMPMALKLASRLQSLVFKDAATGGGLVSRFSLPLVASGRLIPELPSEFFLDRRHVKKFSRAHKNEKTEKPRVGFFVGCGVNYLLPDIGEATVKVLEECGAEVIVPDAQVCCGMPALSSGERASAAELALKNLEVFEKYELDFITTSCATCGHALKDVFKTVLFETDGSPEMANRVEAFTAKVRDITELLENELGYEGKEAGARNEKVAYHDPCHLKKYQGITEEPRILIEKSGATYTKMKNPCKCCGLGGSLGFTNYELSMDIARKKAKNIIASGADTLATACPGCIIQLKDALHQEGGAEIDINVIHVVELL